MDAWFEYPNPDGMTLFELIVILLSLKTKFLPPSSVLAVPHFQICLHYFVAQLARITKLANLDTDQVYLSIHLFLRRLG